MNLMTQAHLPLSPSYFTIELTHNQVALVDSHDWAHVSLIKWSALFCRKLGGYYAVASLKGERGFRKTIYMHRFIMKPPPHLTVDHANPKLTLDNRRYNLRVATRSQNQTNRKRQSNNTSGYKGVCFFKPTGRWMAYINVNGKRKHLGYFATKEEAYAAYCVAALKYHGEFARLK
jgi:hypothetical protein